MTFQTTISRLTGALAALPVLGLGALAEPQARVSGPVVHENIAVYFVHGPSAPGPVPQTLQEALAKGTVEVNETGNVQQLTIENKGAEAVFVQFGDIVKGGQQDRVLTVSLLIEPKSGVIPIGAYCVEQGRWSARGKEDVKRFALSEAIMPSREAKIAMAKPAAPRPEPRAILGAAREADQHRPAGPGATTGTPEQRSADIERLRGELRQLQGNERHVAGHGGSDGQSEVWRSVGVVQGMLSANLGASVASETSRTSLQLALEHGRLKEAQAAYLAALEPKGLEADDIIGVVIAVNGRFSNADVYPSNGHFRKMWPKLARSAATEALSVKQKPAGDKAAGGAAASAAAAPAVPPAIDAVTAFLAEAETGKPSERQLAGIARHETRDSDKALRIEAKSASGALVHRNYLAK